jgi:hypothetical protein
VRRAAKVDANHGDISKAARGIGATFQSLAMVGQGCPDAVIGFREKNYLIEIKDGSKSPSERRLTAAEAEWHRDWRGHVAIIENVDQLFALLGVVR